MKGKETGVMKDGGQQDGDVSCVRWTVLWQESRWEVYKHVQVIEQTGTIFDNGAINTKNT